MPAYEYKAVDAEGRNVVGIMEADSIEDTRVQLTDMALFPLNISVAKANMSSKLGRTGLTGQRISPEHLSLLTRQLATLLESGLPLDDSLDAILKQSKHRVMKRILADIRSQVREGQTLESALKQYPRSFPLLYIASVAAGERSGNLAKIMVQLADYLEQRAVTGKKLSLALVYPAILLLLSVSVICGLMVWVIPSIVGIIETNGQQVPALTAWLTKLSDFVVNYGLWLAGILVVCALLTPWLISRLNLNTQVDIFLFKAPLLGSFIAEQHTARYMGTLGILLSSGIPLSEAMQISARVAKNRYINGLFLHMADRVRDGHSLFSTVSDSQLFNPMATQLIHSGEKSGDLAAMLNKAARLQESHLERKTLTFVSLFEPITLLMMGAIVLVIVIAVMLPILNFNQLVN